MALLWVLSSPPCAASGLCPLGHCHLLGRWPLHSAIPARLLCTSASALAEAAWGTAYEKKGCLVTVRPTHKLKGLEAGAWDAAKAMGASEGVGWAGEGRRQLLLGVPSS